jgi:hypothetical protein
VYFVCFIGLGVLTGALLTYRDKKLSVSLCVFAASSTFVRKIAASIPAPRARTDRQCDASGHPIATASRQLS